MDWTEIRPREEPLAGRNAMRVPAGALAATVCAVLAALALWLALAVLRGPVPATSAPAASASRATPASSLTEAIDASSALSTLTYRQRATLATALSRWLASEGYHEADVSLGSAPEARDGAMVVDIVVDGRSVTCSLVDDSWEIGRA